MYNENQMMRAAAERVPVDVERKIDAIAARKALQAKPTDAQGRDLSTAHIGRLEMREHAPSGRIEWRAYTYRRDPATGYRCGVKARGVKLTDAQGRTVLQAGPWERLLDTWKHGRGVWVAAWARPDVAGVRAKDGNVLAVPARGA